MYILRHQFSDYFHSPPRVYIYAQQLKKTHAVRLCKSNDILFQTELEKNFIALETNFINALEVVSVYRVFARAQRIRMFGYIFGFFFLFVSDKHVVCIWSLCRRSKATNEQTNAVRASEDPERPRHWREQIEICEKTRQICVQIV